MEHNITSYRTVLMEQNAITAVSVMFFYSLLCVMVRRYLRAVLSDIMMVQLHMTFRAPVHPWDRNANTLLPYLPAMPATTQRTHKVTN